MFLTMLLAPMMEVFGQNNKDNKPILIMTTQTGGKETDQFDCRSKIYVDFFLSELPEEHHKLEAFWYNPAGQRQEYTKYEFIGNYAQLWLELHPSFGGKLFSGIDPTAGMSDFIGEWKVKVYFDERFLERKVFYVVC